MLGLLFSSLVLSTGAALALTPVARRLAWRFEVVARPAEDRWNETPTALLGGVALFAAVAVGLGAVAALSWPFSRGWETLLAGEGLRGVGILAAATLMFLTGLADDYFDFRPATKLVLQAVAATVLISTGIVIRVTGLVPVDVLVTYFWFIGITNALNLLDNMDGVAVGIAAIAALFLAIAFGRENSFTLAAVCLAVAGAAAGFLPYNFHKASIFMGDSGSLFLGSLLAGLAAAYPGSATGSLVSVMFAPVLLIVVPILDTTLVAVSRTLAGRPLSMGGRDHTTHRLVALGFSQRQTALILYAFAAASGTGALLLVGRQAGIWFLIIFLAALAVFGAYLVGHHSYAETPPDEAAATGRVTMLVTELLHKRRALEVLLDLGLFGVAYFGAYLLRYDGVVPDRQVLVLEATLAAAVGSQLLGFLIAGVYRGTWQHLSIVDLLRILRGVTLGAVITASTFVFLFRTAEFARSILLIDAILVLFLTAGARLSFRSLDLVHRARRPRGELTALIYGAGSEGESVARALQSRRAEMHPVGFIDDDANRKGQLIHGLAILGSGADLRILLRRHKVKRLLITAQLSRATMEAALQACAAEGVDVLRVQLRFEPVQSADADLEGPIPTRIESHPAPGRILRAGHHSP
jgi:UDP-GlcNAc:undecaprenyl-phosphate/decaprenyl-phosphate GlcNAc-1-phosphate transferase